ncbi:polyprenol monophosphomannose synthase [Hypericibacter sp.]|uniref:polyprenol monophosphomannose synthase n=1 Tax=Hypericibacter sp. TaxID=2705401 RepID=UPI003D6D9A5E
MAELCIVLPTFNEADNVAPLAQALDRALPGIDWEAILVDDDSPDGTAARIEALAHPRIRCLLRKGRRGLASAAIEGFLATQAPFVALMDADLQHDEAQLPAMLALAKARELELVVATRYAPGGSGDGFAGRGRAWLSRAGSRASRSLTRETPLSDPMSGFFLMRRELIEELGPRLSPRGYKILLDLVASAGRPLRAGEIPYRFRPRQAGSSKLGLKVGAEFLLLVAVKWWKRGRSA